MSKPVTGDSAPQAATEDSREYPARPLVGVGAFVFDADGALLMIQRGHEPARGKWSIPGGLMEVGETLHAAVAREVEEETGLRVEPVAMVEVVERILRDESPDAQVRYHYVLVDYLCRPMGNAGDAGHAIHAVRAASYASDVRWVPAREWQSAHSTLIESFTRPVLQKAWRMWRQLADASGRAGYSSSRQT